jgi:elongation factor 2
VIWSCLYASQLNAEPVLDEPVYLTEITCPQRAVRGVNSCLSRRRGQGVEDMARAGTLLVQAGAHPPVLETFVFTADLRVHKSGQAFPQCVFDHL